MSDPNQPPSPAHPPAISVRELHAQLASCVGHYFGSLVVRGEVGSVTDRNGNLYFKLKEQAVSLSAVVWSGNRRRLRYTPQEGDEVVVQAAARFKNTSGEALLDVTWAELTGEGRARLELQQRYERLKGLGAFERDRSLPTLPRGVALITSVKSAAFQDFTTTAAERAPGVSLVVYDALMQGEGALRSVSGRLDEALADPRVEVVVLTRGGGAMEELAVFNDEQLTLKVARYPKPIVVSIGHESDHLLAEAAATRRARTPTEAAHMVFPDARELGARLAQLQGALLAGMNRQGMLKAQRLGDLSAALRAPDLAGRAARLEGLTYHAEGAMRARLGGAAAALDALERLLISRSPQARLERFRAGLEGAERALERVDLTGRARARLERAEVQLAAAFEARLAEAGGRFGELVGALHALSPLAVLARGYSVAARPSGEVLRSSLQVAPGDEVVVRLHEGELLAVVREARPPALPSALP